MCGTALVINRKQLIKVFDNVLLIWRIMVILIKYIYMAMSYTYGCGQDIVNSGEKGGDALHIQKTYPYKQCYILYD